MKTRQFQNKAINQNFADFKKLNFAKLLSCVYLGKYLAPKTSTRARCITEHRVLIECKGQ